MAAPTLTYTLSNGSTADADQVMGDLNDLLNGITDGTKDLTISALTCNGAVTLNNHVTLGNGSVDNLTFSGSIASALTPDGDGTRDLGTAALGFRYLYLGDGSGDTGRLGVPTLSGDVTYTLPSLTSTLATTDNAESRGNFLLNSQFGIWQAEGAASGTSATRTVSNGSSSYGPDQWYAKNSLGTNGVITLARTAGSSDMAKYGLSVKITTAPTGSQANGCELYQTLSNPDSIGLYNQTASFTAQVKALGNVNQVGVQFFYKTTEAKVDTAIGSEQTVTVTTGAFATASISAQALGTSQTTSGVIGVRIRITGVSSGNTYDLNNGFIVELPMLNRGSTPASYQPAYRTQGEELTACEYFYEKSYLMDTPPGTSESAGRRSYTRSDGDTVGSIYFKTRKRTAPTMGVYSPTNNNTPEARNNRAGTNVAVTVQNTSDAGTEFSLNSAGAVSDSISFQFYADARI